MHLSNDGHPDFLVHHFAATKAQGDLNFVAFSQKFLHGFDFDLQIMLTDTGAQLDFFNLNNHLLFLGLSPLFLRLIAVFAIVQNFADGGLGSW